MARSAVLCVRLFLLLFAAAHSMMPEKSFVAEWDFHKSVSKSGRSSPPVRSDSHTWTDADGNWWVFGGKSDDGDAVNYLSDLWMYNAKTSKWDRKFPMDTDAGVRVMSLPERIPSPTICGVTGNSVAVYSASQQAAPLSSDTVWVYDINDGLWTSYVCCDACLPDVNATSTFCPDFHDPLVWCDNNSTAFMALNIAVTNLSKTMGSNITNNSASESIGNSTSPQLPNRTVAVEWWKFDLRTTEWQRMSQVTVKERVKPWPCQPGSVRTVSDGRDLFIICIPLSGSIMERKVFRLDTGNSTLDLVGHMHLNTVFRNPKMWQSSRSVIHAVHATSQSRTYILVAYQKLLDIWIYEHEMGRLYPIENIWKGKTLRVFQSTTGLYHLVLENLTLYMVNPRNRLSSFEEQGYFVVFVAEDEAIFLPSRDASFNLIHEGQQVPSMFRLMERITSTLPTTSTARSVSTAPAPTTMPGAVTVAVPTTSPGNITSPTTPSLLVTTADAPASSPQYLNDTVDLDEPEDQENITTIAPNLVKTATMRTTPKTTTTTTTTTTKPINTVSPTTTAPATTTTTATPSSAATTPNPDLSTSTDSTTSSSSNCSVSLSAPMDPVPVGDRTLLTLGSAEIVIDSADDVRPVVAQETSDSYGSMLFFAVSLSIFAICGMVMFVRRCVKCPPRRRSVLLKEPPPIRYSVIPDELSYSYPSA